MPRPASGVLAVILAGQFVTVAMADRPFRCGSRIIDTGMTRATVLEHCGEPNSKSTEFREVRSSNNRVLGATAIDRWTYESYSATRVLVFLDDILQSVERL